MHCADGNVGELPVLIHCYHFLESAMIVMSFSIINEKVLRFVYRFV